MAGQNNWPYIINLGNSIIGVALLAMPFCFKQCGILLGMIVLLFCTWLTLTSCQLLMRAGIHSRRRSYEFLAYYTHGATGKFVSELGMIGMQVGTLIAQIVVIGDLGPAIVSKFLGLENTFGLRTFLILALCLGVGLPLGLLKDLRAVSRASTVCISFYCIFILYVIVLSLPNVLTGEWYQKVSYWRPEGFFQCLPILSFSFGCQTQLFLLYEALPDPSLKAISGVISSAVNLCAVAYLLVGFFGYVAFHNIDIPGDVISVFPNTFFADVMKICFVFSIVITFPVIIFPCRSSIYTLLFAKKSKAHDDVLDTDGYLPEKLFKGITVFIVVSCMILGILIPNVEFVLGLNGAIMGTLICYVFPAMFFLKVMGNKQDNRGMAQIVLILGVIMLLLSTYATLSSQGKEEHHPGALQPEDLGGVPALPRDVVDNPVGAQGILAEQLIKPLVTESPIQKKENVKDDVIVKDDKRQEPPNPDPPDEKPAGEVPEVAKNVVREPEEVKKAAPEKDPKVVIEHGPDRRDDEKAIKETKDAEEVVKAADANKAKELELQEKEKKQDELLQQLEKHREEQEKLIKEQRQLLKEFKDHHEKDLKNDELHQEKEKLQEKIQQEAQSALLQVGNARHGQENNAILNPVQQVDNHQQPNAGMEQQLTQAPQQQLIPQNEGQERMAGADLHQQPAPVNMGVNTGLGAGENLRDKKRHVHPEALAGVGQGNHAQQQAQQQHQILGADDARARKQADPNLINKEIQTGDEQKYQAQLRDSNQLNIPKHQRQPETLVDSRQRDQHGQDSRVKRSLDEEIKPIENAVGQEKVHVKETEDAGAKDIVLGKVQKDEPDKDSALEKDGSNKDQQENRLDKSIHRESNASNSILESPVKVIDPDNVGDNKRNEEMRRKLKSLNLNEKSGLLNSNIV